MPENNPRHRKKIKDNFRIIPAYTIYYKDRISVLITETGFLISDHQVEIPRFRAIFEIDIYKGKIGCTEREGHCLCFTGFQADLFKRTQTLHARGDTRILLMRI